MNDEVRKVFKERGFCKYERLAHNPNSKSRTCSKCKEKKPNTAEFFHKSGKILAYICKDCKRIIDREYRKTSEVHKEYVKSPKFVFAQLRYQARKRKMPFELDYDYYLDELAFKPCHYCGSNNTKHLVDRHINDHSIGYTVENAVPCCELCNKMKSSHSYDVFLSHCKSIVSHNNS